MSFDQWRVAMREELEQLEDDLHYTERTYFETAGYYRRVHDIGGIAAAVLATASGAAVIVSWSSTFAAVAALFAALLSTVLTFMRPDRQAAQYLTAGRDLAELRTRLRHVTKIDLPRAEFAEMRDALEDLRAAKSSAVMRLPPTSDRHFIRARQRIQAGLYDKDARDAE